VPTFPFPETFTILTGVVTGQDGDGNDVTTPAEVATSGAFAPTGSTELIQGEAVVLDHDTIYLSDGAPTPGPADKIRARGVVYDIDGTPAEYHNPLTGYEPGAVLRLLKVT
jgi:hypothetical protein